MLSLDIIFALIVSRVRKGLKMLDFIRTPAAAKLVGMSAGQFRRQLQPRLHPYGTKYPYWRVADLAALRGRPIEPAEVLAAKAKP
jgi:hypothetical protein